MQQDQLVRVKDVVKLTGISRATIYRRMDDDKFPKPKQVSTRVVAWKLSDIQNWIANVN